MGKVLINRALSINKELPTFDDTSWGGASDEDLVEILQLADNGKINLKKDLGWKLGDEREVSISAIDRYCQFSQPKTSLTYYLVPDISEKKITFVLADYDNVELSEPLPSGKTTCHFTVVAKEKINDDPRTGAGDIGSSPDTVWRDSHLRTWCNVNFREAISSNIRNIFKLHKTIYANASFSTYPSVDDYFSYPAKMELWGSESYTADGVSQWRYSDFKTNWSQMVMARNRNWKNGDGTGICSDPGGGYLYQWAKSNDFGDIIVWGVI
jgi:hypothetical protein